MSMIDLHMHSSYSNDGEFTPKRLVQMCHDAGISTMSITDHNCARANAEAIPSAEKYGIRYITGIEIDCCFDGVNFHVLGYGIDDSSRDFELIEKNAEAQEQAASIGRLEKTLALGFKISEKELKQLSQSIWTGEMFAEILLKKAEYANSPILAPYRPGGKRSDNPYVNFYWDYYSQGKPCYTEMSFPAMRDVIDIIHSNGGKAVLAHPGVNLKGHEELLPLILSLGIDGIEAFSSYHSPERAAYYCRQAAEHDLMITCGSDFHGKTKPSVHLGGHGGTDYKFLITSI